MPIRKTRRCYLAAALILLAPAVLGAAQDSSRIADSEVTGYTAIPSIEQDPLDLDWAMLTSDDAQLAGREVVATHVLVMALTGEGFWAAATAGKEPVFVVPAEGALITVRPGEFVNLHGEIRLSATRRQRDASLNLPTPRLTPYVYAYTVRPAS
jgi:hypothetical protein